MSGNGDFFVGYGAGQQAGRNQASGQYDEGFNDGKKAGFSDATDAVRGTQGRFILRLMRHLMARNTQKKALMEELKKYSPEHPFLDETPILDNSMAKAHELSEHPDDLDYKMAVTGIVGEREALDRKVSNVQITDSQEAVNMLVVEVDGLTTKGDMAMVDAGVAVVADGKDNRPAEMTDAITDKSQEIFAKYNPSLLSSVQRTQALVNQTKVEKKEAVREERSKTFIGSFINALSGH